MTEPETYSARRLGDIERILGGPETFDCPTASTAMAARRPAAPAEPLDTHTGHEESTMQTQTAQPYHLAAGDGQPMSWFTAEFQLKASDGQIGLMELTASPGIEPPMHVHAHEDEWYYVLDGDVTFHVGTETYSATIGSIAFLPRAMPHTFTIESTTARMLLLNAPGGFERMFELAPNTPEEAISALTRYDVEVVGPHPRDAGPQPAAE